MASKVCDGDVMPKSEVTIASYDFLFALMSSI